MATITGIRTMRPQANRYINPTSDVNQMRHRAYPVSGPDAQKVAIQGTYRQSLPVVGLAAVAITAGILTFSVAAFCAFFLITAFVIYCGTASGSKETMNALFNAAASFNVSSRMGWIRLNRILAWLLIVSPIVQLVFGTSFRHSITADLIVLVTHGVLSLILFGAPKLKVRKFVPSMHIFGYRTSDMSQRNTFLLTGYRITLGLAAIGLLFVPGVRWLALVCGSYPIARLQISVIQHIHGAATYALLRWGKRRDTVANATAIVILYFSFSIINLVVNLIAN